MSSILTGLGLISINGIKKYVKIPKFSKHEKMMEESYSACNFESENNNFKSKKSASGGVMELRRKCYRATL